MFAYEVFFGLRIAHGIPGGFAEQANDYVNSFSEKISYPEPTGYEVFLEKIA